ncbi:MAG: hypothetical protein LQ350_003873 [Teloschistes chrysophthalmus]|nr:MAG: hypothetical protein LQ350_003873 [Niorma chrysophthalma]
MLRASQPIKPNYGSRLLPQVLDELSQNQPERIYASFPKGSDLDNGFRNVTMLQMARAVNHMAWWLQGKIGKSSTFETLSYLGLPDIRYAVVFLAAVKCGYKEKPQLEILQVPSLNDMLVDSSEYYPFEKDFAIAKFEPIVVLHSSGSTGVPKPITMNHATYAVVDSDRNLDTVPGRRNQNFSLWNFGEDGGFSFSSIPPFHLGGFVAYIALPIYSTYSSVVLGPADKPSTGQTTAGVMRHFDLKALFCPPNIYEQLLQETDAIELASKLKFIMYAGGPLTTVTGTTLSKVTDVCGFYGSTETSPAQALVPAREDWDTLEFHPLYGADFQPSVDDAYELVLHRESKYEGIRGLESNFRDINEWRTRDLFRPHATKANLWRFHGRTDDIIVLSNGEKFNPVPSEAIINSHPLVSAALIVGQGHFQGVLIIEPAKTDVSPGHLIEELWPTVEHANSQAQSHGRIVRSMTAIADPSKPFERAGKGTVVRKLTAEKFADEITALYTDYEVGKLQGGPQLSSPHDAAAVHHFVSQAIAFCFPVKGMKSDDDLYVLGLDSLKTIEIVAVLKAGLGNNDSTWISHQVLYRNPTIGRLTQYVYARLHGRMTGDPQSSGDVSSKSERIDAMTSLVQRYTRDLAKPRTILEERSAPQCIVLTGSTGSLGQQLLRRILSISQVKKVYCFDRSPNASSKYINTFRNHEDSDGVTFLQVDYGHAKFGQSESTYEDLLTNVDRIIHVAWKVDFNQSLQSFEPVHIRGLRHFIDSHLQSPKRPRIVFISSASSVSRWPLLGNNDKGRPVPDAFILDFEAAQRMGYAESKNVAEHILHAAGEKAGVLSDILRIGQIGGPLTEKGKWNEDEWVAALVKSSKATGCLPRDLPDVDWIPVGIVASIIVELCFRAPPDEQGGMVGSSSFFNVVNPHSASWNALLPTLQKHMGEGTQVVPVGDWVENLEKMDASKAEVAARYPAVKILDFFHDYGMTGRVIFRTDRAVLDSDTVARSEAVDGKMMEVWMGQWGF